jgi:predicted amidophosphoribosyltransferase
MRELVQSFKYRDRQEGLALFARWLAKAGGELLADADLIVPVPLYATRLWRRRFNQSAMLAVALGPGAEAGGSGEGRYFGTRPRRRARRLGALILRERP